MLIFPLPGPLTFVMLIYLRGAFRAKSHWVLGLCGLSLVCFLQARSRGSYGRLPGTLEAGTGGADPAAGMEVSHLGEWLPWTFRKDKGLPGTGRPQCSCHTCSQFSLVTCTKGAN